MKTAEEILKEYVAFEDMNGNESVTLLPLTIIDAMEEYADQFRQSVVMPSLPFAERNVRDLVDLIKYRIQSGLFISNGGYSATMRRIEESFRMWDSGTKVDTHPYEQFWKEYDELKAKGNDR